MSEVSNVNLSNFSVGNTIVSSQTILPIFSPSSINSLAYQVAINPNPAIAIVSGTNTYTLDFTHFIQASIGQQYINISNWTDTATPKYLSVGADTPANAASIISLLSLTSTYPYRTLTFQYANNTHDATQGAVSGLKNSSASSNNVKISAYDSGSVTYQATMKASGYGRDGEVVKIRVYGSIFTDGNEVVIFQILTNPSSLSF